MHKMLTFRCGRKSIIVNENIKREHFHVPFFVFIACVQSSRVCTGLCIKGSQCYPS